MRSNTSEWRAAGGVAAAFMGAAVLGLLHPMTAQRLHVLTLPALAVGVVVAAASLRRMEIGICAALLLAALSPTVAGRGAWVPGLAWIVMLAGIAFLLRGPSLPRDRQRHLPPLGALVLLYLVTVVVSFAQTPAASYALSTLRSTVTGTLLFFVIATYVRSRREIEWTVNGFLVGGLLVGGIAIVQWLTGAVGRIGFLTETGQLIYRVTGGLNHPNQLGGFLVVLVPLALGGAAARRHRAARAAFAAMAVVAIYASFSRGALVALASVPLVMLRPRTLVLVVPALAAAMLLLAPAALEERFQTATAGGSEFATRMDIFTTAAAIWAEDPLLGNGLGSFPEAYADARVPEKSFLPGTFFTPPPHAHNLYLQLLAEQGLLGATAFVALMAMAARHAFRLRRSASSSTAWYGRAVLAAIVAFGVHNLLDVTLLEQTGIYFFALLGLVSALTAQERAAAREAEAPAAVAPLAVAPLAVAR